MELTADLELDVDCGYLEMCLSHLRVRKHSEYLLCRVRRAGMLTYSDTHKLVRARAHARSTVSASDMLVVIPWYEHVPYTQPVVTALE